MSDGPSDGSGTGRIAVIGAGLVGASLALAIKRRRHTAHVTCLDLPHRLGAICDAGVCDAACSTLDAPSVLPECGLVVLAAPVQAILTLLPEIAPHLAPGTIVTDVGSTKVEICRKAREVLPETVHFVGGHPIAGAETSGVDAADPLLFKGRVYMLCPEQTTPPEVMLALIDWVEDLMALPVTIEAEEHDRILSIVSHVPQLVAIALVHAALADDATHGLLDTIAGRGFLDLTRVAASDFEVWRGILATNMPAIRAGLDRLEKSVGEVRGALESGELALLWQRVSGRRRRMSVDSVPRPRKPELRALVDRCDEQILKSLGNRLRVVHQIGEIKKTHDMPVLDPDRERKAVQARLEWARALDVPADLVTELFQVIMKYSRMAQDRDAAKSK